MISKDLLVTAGYLRNRCAEAGNWHCPECGSSTREPGANGAECPACIRSVWPSGLCSRCQEPVPAGAVGERTCASQAAYESRGTIAFGPSEPLWEYLAPGHPVQVITQSALITGFRSGHYPGALLVKDGEMAGFEPAHTVAVFRDVAHAPTPEPRPRPRTAAPRPRSQPPSEPPTEIRPAASPVRQRLPVGAILGVFGVFAIIVYFVTSAIGLDHQVTNALSGNDVVRASQVLRKDGGTDKLAAATRVRLATAADRWLGNVLQVWMLESTPPASGWAAAADVAWAAQAVGSNDLERAPILQYLLGQIAFDGQRYSEARQFFSSALSATGSTTRALAQNGIGKSCWRQSDTVCAVGAYRAAIATEPTWAYPYRNLAGVLVSQRKYVEAEQYYLGGIERMPDRASSHLNLAELYFTQRRYPEARSEYEQAQRFLRSSDEPSISTVIRRRLAWMSARGR
jgi:Flp pilus assembly protein TadD